MWTDEIGLIGLMFMCRVCTHTFTSMYEGGQTKTKVKTQPQLGNRGKGDQRILASYIFSFEIHGLSYE
jgi:hypothetical protein